MATRRTFIKSSVLGAASLSANKLLSSVSATSLQSQKPIVLSTWDFGIPANSGAWKI
jgi:N4-(beta-N-acetylglucosaminyl)-L-asparaginase